MTVNMKKLGLENQLLRVMGETSPIHCPPADFGLANFLRPKNRQPLTSRVVTLWYHPPELLLGATDYGEAIDLWSVGCVFAEIFLGKPLFKGRTEWKGESLQESLKRHEHFLALQLGLKPGQKVLDVGCGIGGPLREIARFSKTSVTGLNNNEYQITRGKALNRVGGVDQTCDFVKDLAKDSPIPWYLPMDTSQLSLSSFRLTAIGRFFTRNMVMALEKLGVAPKGSQRVQSFLEKAAEGLVAGAKKEIFTSMYFFVARKPLSEAQ
ncbi:hypothetical protein CASFOL_009181 [Castilleja foliolosa]|uniref:SAM-dependent methyltransferase Erg6/SMT-type domain-containing protein n=1 Tax=Castilleja foliolosa TaxID=1961234 RepID=A0ABD3DYP1_9LAMI